MKVTQNKKIDRSRNQFDDLTKRTIVQRARFAGRRAALRAMRVMGFVVTIEDGWVIKKFKDGKIERVSKIAH